MMVDTGAPSAVAERVRELCRQFKLPTLAAETVRGSVRLGVSSSRHLSFADVQASSSPTREYPTPPDR